MHGKGGSIKGCGLRRGFVPDKDRQESWQWDRKERKGEPWVL